jgi:acyl-CoA synthetase (AMP-forming)/AMP-acid ligase II
MNYSFQADARHAGGRRSMDVAESDRYLVVIAAAISHRRALVAMQGYAVGAAGVIVDTRCLAGFTVNRAAQSCKAVLVPSMIQLMLAEPGCSQTDFSSFKGLVYGGSPIPRRCYAAMDPLPAILQIYGLTETGNITVFAPCRSRSGGHHE